MSENIQKRTLLVISDTSMRKAGYSILAYEPVIRELEALTELFDEIIWLGCKDNRQGRVLAEIENHKIKAISMPSVQNRFLNIVFAALAYPVFLFHILRHLSVATHVHSRGPSHPAFIGVFISLFDRKRTYWHKYAGDWYKKDIPFMYSLQRRILQIATKQNTYVTISGKYVNEDHRIIAFENPCITDDEHSAATTIALQKDFSGNLTLLFVGTMVTSKGVNNLVSALADPTLSSRINKIHLVGSGPLLNTIKQQAASINKDMIITGQLTRQQLAILYAQSHIIILPSISEGFPKVIAEAAAYGCIPIVTSVSAIPQYITNNDNGFLLDDNSPQAIIKSLNHLSSIDNKKLSALSSSATNISRMFTYGHYINKLKNTILKLS